MKLDWPLMENNITRDDLDVVVEFLKEQPRLTQSDNVLAFEKEWSEWLGVRFSIFVNSLKHYKIGQKTFTTNNQR